MKIYVAAVEALIDKCDETLRIIKGGIQRKKRGRDPCPREQKNHQKRPNHQRTSNSLTAPLASSISNNERGGPPKRMLSLEEASPMAPAHFKIEIV
jgi:hypothetical protein